MEIMDSIRLLYCFNEAGVNKAYELLGELLHNPEYILLTPEKLVSEIEERRKQDEIKQRKKREERMIMEEAREAEIDLIRKEYNNELEMIEKNNRFWNHKDVLEAIDITVHPCFKISGAYTWGLIQGKRAERARRKKVAL